MAFVMKNGKERVHHFITFSDTYTCTYTVYLAGEEYSLMERRRSGSSNIDLL